MNRCKTLVRNVQYWDQNEANMQEVLIFIPESSLLSRVSVSESPTVYANWSLKISTFIILLKFFLLIKKFSMQIFR